MQELESWSISLDQTWAWWKSLCHTGDFRMSIGKDEQRENITRVHERGDNAEVTALAKSQTKPGSCKKC